MQGHGLAKSRSRCTCLEFATVINRRFPLRFRIASPRVSIDLGCTSVERNSWRGDPESLRANRSAYYPRDQSLFVYYQTGTRFVNLEKPNNM